MSAITVDGTPYVIGEKYLIRTVTMYWAGVLKMVHDHELVLSKGTAAFVKCMSSFKDAKNGKFDSYEPVNDEVIIGRPSIVDVVKISMLPGEGESNVQDQPEKAGAQQ